MAWGVKELDDIYEEALKCDVPLLKEQTAQDDAAKSADCTDYGEGFKSCKSRRVYISHKLN